MRYSVCHRVSFSISINSRFWLKNTGSADRSKCFGQIEVQSSRHGVGQFGSLVLTKLKYKIQYSFKNTHKQSNSNSKEKEKYESTNFRDALHYGLSNGN